MLTNPPAPYDFMALVEAFSVIVKTACGTDGALHSTSYHISRPEFATRKQCAGEISESRRNMCVLCEHYDINQCAWVASRHQGTLQSMPTLCITNSRAGEKQATTVTTRA